nr:MAG TPA: ERF superfamily protein [Caudoviricetes sp.]
MGVYAKLLEIQQALKAPKGQTNTFGKYNYRSCEDIVEAVKPLLGEQKVVLTISDEIKLVGERYYIFATATIIDAETGETVAVTAQAREANEKRGMDTSQVTGATSSYARKYALNGLLAIDDTKDADAQAPTQEPAQEPANKPLPRCEMCGGDITADILGDGKLYSPNQIARATKKQTGQQICSECMRKLKHETTA